MPCPRRRTGCRGTPSLTHHLSGTVPIANTHAVSAFRVLSSCAATLRCPSPYIRQRSKAGLRFIVAIGFSGSVFIFHAIMARPPPARAAATRHLFLPTRTAPTRRSSQRANARAHTRHAPGNSYRLEPRDRLPGAERGASPANPLTFWTCHATIALVVLPNTRDLSLCASSSLKTTPRSPPSWSKA